MKHLLTLDEIHQRELQLFRCFDSFCRQNNLRYYMCGGTLLGAVRHGGFIPWDDDIDLLMPRPDYERLQNLIRAQPFLPSYEFHSRTLGNLHENFTKLVDLKTEVDKEYTFDIFDRHLWIDVFPMDGLPDDLQEVEIIFKKVNLARRILKFLKAKPGTGKSKWKILVKPLLKPIVQHFWSMEKLLQYVDDIAKAYSFENSTYVGGIVYGYGPQERMLRNEYVSGIPMQFEGLESVAPGCFDVYLTALFGEYMQLPPEEKRQIHFMKIYGW